jgi:drug/metabolite transporter (DMT)-like permease
MGFMHSIFLYVLAVLIWGSTWLVITFQLGVVDPSVSVTYRFALAALLLICYCLLKRLNLVFKARDHLFMAGQGLLLFGISYWFTYQAELYLTSALAAVISTSIIYFNVFFGRIWLKTPVVKSVLAGALIGSLGILLIFYPELDISARAELWLGIGLMFASSILASFGSLLSAYNQRHQLPVVQTNAWGMFYASIFMGLFALISGKTFSFDFSFAYISSLLYLALFGSVIAFGAYLTLLGKIGADKAGYVVLVYPVVALLLSTIFEGYQWSTQAIIGLLLILAGNYIAMKKPKVAN